MSKVDELKDRFIEMVDQGLTRFGWTVGPKWHSLTIEEKAATILETWNAPSRSVTAQEIESDPPRSGRPKMTIDQVVAEATNPERT